MGIDNNQVSEMYTYSPRQMFSSFLQGLGSVFVSRISINMQEIWAWISSSALKYIIYTGAEILGQGMRWGLILFTYLWFFIFLKKKSPTNVSVAKEHMGQKYHVCFTKKTMAVDSLCHTCIKCWEMFRWTSLINILTSSRNVPATYW